MVVPPRMPFPRCAHSFSKHKGPRHFATFSLSPGNWYLQNVCHNPTEKMLSNPLIKDKITLKKKSFVQKEAQKILKINIRDLVLFLLLLEKPTPFPTHVASVR